MRKILLVGLAAMIVAVGGCAREAGGAADAAPEAGGTPGVEGCATPPSPPESVVTAGATMYPESDELSEALGSIQQAGESTFRDVFAGLETVPEQGYVIVYRLPSARFDAYVRDVAAGQCVLLRDAAHSAAELSALQDRITDDMDYWRTRGVDVNAVGPRHDGSGVVVSTLAVARARAELPKRYGTAIPIIIEQGGPVELLGG
ncbi:hypothetical protein K7640_20815 [Micromonospora sp. PLK6-60]|uniref:hypothetical protein n=1 Tax=Micromonospora sp. PLK6-60 TaxID=2873383 RepID=UPI001CA6C5BE|nr:hypothetical protein [Micromonospora sp. PLK6-60]MBY8874276.1 hypothetical protein [Micromonospora sp. PLK6-60]